MKLYHYTCGHFAPGIVETGLVLPSPITKMSWFTDLDTPIPEVLGLTSHLLPCDRTAFRFRLLAPHDTNGEVVPYHEIRHFLDPITREGLETAPGALLMHWWTSELPVGVELA
jgi:hypothetical protein